MHFSSLLDPEIQPESYAREVRKGLNTTFSFVFSSSFVTFRLWDDIGSFFPERHLSSPSSSAVEAKNTLEYKKCESEPIRLGLVQRKNCLNLYVTIRSVNRVCCVRTCISLKCFTTSFHYKFLQFTERQIKCIQKSQKRLQALSVENLQPFWPSRLTERSSLYVPGL